MPRPNNGHFVRVCFGALLGELVEDAKAGSWSEHPELLSRVTKRTLAQIKVDCDAAEPKAHPERECIDTTGRTVG